MQNLKSNSIYAVKWNSINQISRFVLRFGISVVLARLLNPKDFGLMAMILILTNLSYIFINSGFNNALIQKKTLSQEEYSSVFFFNIALGAFFSILVWYSGTLLSRFYQAPLLETLTRTISVVYLIDAFSIVQRSHLTRELAFKRLSIVEILGIVFSGVVGIGSAFYGQGVWSLVWAQLSRSFITVILFWIISPWRPKIIFRFEVIKNLWRYSYNILGGNILNHLTLKLDVLILGKLVSPELLGLYYKGRANSEIPSNLIAQVSARSFFPILSKLQDDKIRFKKMYLTLLNAIAFISLPLFVFLIITANNLIEIVFGTKWLGMVPYFRLFCIGAILNVINLLKVYSINALGLPQYNLKLALIMSPPKLVALLLIAFIMPEVDPKTYIGVIIFFMLLDNLCRTLHLSKIISVSYRDEFSNTYKEVLVAVGAGLVSFMIIPKLGLNIYSELITYLIGYLFLYFSLAYFQNFAGIRLIVDYIKEKQVKDEPGRSIL
ncbi:MAG: lipopolysaccharide biosynthesis protein [Bacteroidetes bacterium]|nr:lipopolysaccharide biosynthesis protein [Bacteroidota bacterium]